MRKHTIIARLVKSPRGVFEPAMSEEDVLGAIRALLELNGARVHRIVERIPWGRTASEGGIPDLFGWWPANPKSPYIHHRFPRHFFLEVKKPGGKLRPAQVAWIEAARQDGVMVFFADSVEAMVKGFAEYGIEIKGLQ